MAAISIGGASGYWGDAPHATRQLLDYPKIDFLVYDYLAEVTLSIMARQRAKDASLGYATDFVTALKPALEQIARRNIKVISNAGGMNPQACASAVRVLVAELGLTLNVTVVEGDDLIDRLEDIESTTEMFTGERFPAKERVVSANAYLGALPIVKALKNGADIVITGRCVDSAVTLGACIASFDWSFEDFDKLAQASLAGHLIECGPQATGGNFTDWRALEGPLENIGYPVAVVEEDGTFSITKPSTTSGLVSVATVAEQLVYEIHDPQDYLLPDVSCDFSQAMLEQVDADVVRVSGARGYPPPESYKVSVTYSDGYKAGMSLGFFGFEAAAKATAFADASFARTDRTLSDLGLPAISDKTTELVGSGSQFGQSPQAAAEINEIQLNIAVKHEKRAGVAAFIQSVSGMGLATPAGMALFQAGRSTPSPVIRHFSCARDKKGIELVIDDGVTRHAFSDYTVAPISRSIERPTPPEALAQHEIVEVSLLDLAYGRSGDKGDRANVGIIARTPEALPWIWASLTPEKIASVFAHFNPSHVERFLLPGIHAINFVLHDVLGGGGMASIRSDAQGKAYAQILLHQTVSVPTHLAESL
ncbi:MAG: acyclic terpene utilization AtuA family protein [Gammaproteobacteria bacterium]